MTKHRTSRNRYFTDLDPIVRLWALRILVPLSGHREFLHQHGFHNDALAVALGLGHWVDASQYCVPEFLRRGNSESHTKAADREFDTKAVRLELRQLHQQAESELKRVKVPTRLMQNVTRLSRLVGLGATDCRLLEFALIISNDPILESASEYLGVLSTGKVFHILSCLLALPEPDIRSCLSAQAILSNAGLLTIDRSGVNLLPAKLSLLSDSFADLMANSEAEPINLLKGTVSAVPSGALELSDYDHIRPWLDILLPYLRHAQTAGKRGVNIFLHGAPGTGKSELARTVAKALGCELFEIASEGVGGDPVDGERRLCAFRAAQSFFAQRRALVVFDEVEDVFNDGNSLFGRKSTAQAHKAWINRTLEDNPVPTLWLSNSIRCLDPAFIRRFDMVFELPVPPQKQRARILQASCGDLLEADHIARIAEVKELAPAVVARACAVVRSIRDEIGASHAATAFESLLSNTLEAQGHRPLVQNDPNQLPRGYDPRFIHTDADLAAVAAGLQSAKSGRLCLYGPPGTGKTAYGRWVAQQLGAPLLVKRASDLLGPYVGENERNIALAFRQAQTDGAVLLLDEVDSFLQDRRAAQRGWEVSLVNEMLTQMESFAGVFIASTNLMDGLDQAALRRFDLKVKFDFLGKEQAWELFCRHCTSLNLPLPCPSEQDRLSRLRRLTPGDFAAVLRQHRFRPIEGADALLSALESECRLKEGTARNIGFMSS